MPTPTQHPAQTSTRLRNLRVSVGLLPTGYGPHRPIREPDCRRSLTHPRSCSWTLPALWELGAKSSQTQKPSPSWSKTTDASVPLVPVDYSHYRFSARDSTRRGDGASPIASSQSLRGNYHSYSAQGSQPSTIPGNCRLLTRRSLPYVPKPTKLIQDPDQDLPAVLDEGVRTGVFSEIKPSGLWPPSQATASFTVRTRGVSGQLAPSRRGPRNCCSPSRRGGSCRMDPAGPRWTQSCQEEMAQGHCRRQA